MNRTVWIIIAALLISALAVPALAGTARDSSWSSATNKIYNGGATVVSQTEGIFSGCLKTVFCLFNPCLDVVKGCTNVVLNPIDRSFAYAERSLYKSSRKPAGKKKSGSKKAK
jgi:hypothetical protein